MANSIKLSLKIIPFLVVIATIGGLGDAVDPGATKCWNFKVGRFMTQGGSNEQEQIKECSANQYCYIGKISGDDDNKQGLHATRWQFQGGCVSEGHEIFEHPGIDKENMPSCSNEKHSNLDVVCVCNTDECNNKMTLQKFYATSIGQEQRSALSGSSEVKTGLLLTITTLFAVLFWKFH